MRAIFEALLGQRLADELLEGLGIAAVTDAEEVVETLAGSGVHVPVGRPFLARERQPDIGGAFDCGARHLLAELQHEESGNLVGGILLAAEHGQIEDIIDGMPQLMQHHADEAADEHFLAGETFGRDACRCQRSMASIHS